MPISSLSMEIWCVTAFFAPFESELRYRNFEIFARGILKSGVRLLTIELLYPWTTRRLPKLGHIATLESKDVLWHKEAMLNYGFSLLPISCDVAICMDCDLLFEETDWLSRLTALIKKNDLIQCFQTCHRLPQGSPFQKEYAEQSTQSVMHSYFIDPDSFHSRTPRAPSAPGGCWAFAKPYFYGNPLYERGPVGSGDHIFAYAVIGELKNSPFLDWYSPLQQKDALQWATRIPKGLPTSFLPVDVFHLWHGSMRSRLSKERGVPLKNHAFDPQKDLKKEKGLYQWCSPKKALHQSVYTYFFQRASEESRSLMPYLR